MAGVGATPISASSYSARLPISNRKHDVSIGGLCHAARAAYVERPMNQFVSLDRLHGRAGTGHFRSGAPNHRVAGVSSQQAMVASALRHSPNQYAMHGR